MYYEAGRPTMPMSSATAVPPGKYMYTPELPHLMQALRPTYWVVTEPVFMDHLLMHVDQKIRLETAAGPLAGTLAGVAVDHVQIDVNGVPHHVRLSQIVYFTKA
ncbi:DUF2642 domain-containing protein [Paenibacillus antri]|uniref:DUF2642 domain-containing protein n=1 Tax=Paenibacillus antri TaxID=2582848 RepID=A0A5R9GCX2_9BACL|nr:DUF2642 domain-containing protein [Paenibacillus antri]TLS53581.1 DUF2642 domain-containing protein [Paenibacillus antri]